MLSPEKPPSPITTANDILLRLLSDTTFLDIEVVLTEYSMPLRLKHKWWWSGFVGHDSDVVERYTREAVLWNDAIIDVVSCRCLLSRLIVC
jgi:hypothetical protein